MSLQGILNQPQLDLLARVAIAGFDHLDAAAGHGLLKTGIAGLDPARARRPRKPGHLDLPAAGGMAPRHILARLKAHFAKGHQGLRGQFRRRHAVDHVNDRNAAGAHFPDQIIHAVEGDRADHNGLGAAGHAVFNLGDLPVQIGVAASLDQLHLYPQTARLRNHAIVHGRPVGVFHMRKRDTNVPLSGRLIQRPVFNRGPRAVHIKRRVPYLYREWIPIGGARKRSTDCQGARPNRYQK